MQQRLSKEQRKQKAKLVDEINSCRRVLQVYHDHSEYAVNTIERLIVAHIKLAKIVGE